MTHPGVPGPRKHENGERASRPNSGSRAGCSAGVPPEFGLAGTIRGPQAIRAYRRDAGATFWRRDAAAGIFRAGFCLPRSTRRGPQVVLLQRVSAAFCNYGKQAASALIAGPAGRVRRRPWKRPGRNWVFEHCAVRQLIGKWEKAVESASTSIGCLFGASHHLVARLTDAP